MEIKSRGAYKACPNCGENALKSTGMMGLSGVQCENCNAVHKAPDVSRPVFSGKDSVVGFNLSDSTKERLSLNDDTRERLLEKTEHGQEKSQQRFDEIKAEKKARAEERKIVRINEMGEDEIEERIKRIKRGGNGGSMVATSIGLIFFASLLSLTVIGAVIGIPMIVIGISGLIGAPLHSIVDSGERKINGSPWDNTGLREPTMENIEHRKVNKALDCRCPHCNSFVSLRNVEGDFFDRRIKCIKCDVVFEKDLDGVGMRDKPNWRMIEGDSDMVGEAKPIHEWRDIRKEREIKAE